MAMNGGQQVGKNQGTGVSNADALALFLKVFGGEVLTAFARQSQTLNRVMTRTIQSGKSAQFPVLGRTKARYLKAGTSLDEARKDIKHSEQTISIDGLLATDVLVYDIEDAMNHYDVRAEYTKQMGEALAIAADTANFSEMAKLVNRKNAAASANVAGQASNIVGLGTSPLIAIGKNTADAASPAVVGEAIIQALTMMRAQFTKNYVPAGERTFYTTPDNYSAILAALMPNAANYAALIDPETGSIRNVMGFEVVETPHMTEFADTVETPADSIGADHTFPATGADITFDTGALPAASSKLVGANNVMGLAAHRSAVATLKLRDMALERARRAEYKADQIIASYAMGHGGLRPEACGAVVKMLAGTDTGVVLAKDNANVREAAATKAKAAAK